MTYKVRVVYLDGSQSVHQTHGYDVSDTALSLYRETGGLEYLIPLRNVAAVEFKSDE